MGAEWYGDTDGAFFKYDDIAPRRKIKNAFYPLEVYRACQIKVPELQPNEKRILSVDIALMASKKHNNDASALIINSAIPTDNNDYIANFVYEESYEGLTTDELGIIVMRTFYQYHCTDLVLDTNGSGLGLFDFVIKPQYDAEYATTYDAMTCINDDNMADRCKVRNANKVVWSIKASADFNTKSALALRAGFQNGKINLLEPEYDAEDDIKKIRGYSKMSPRLQAMLKLPYIQTSFLVNELINLEHEVRGVNIKIFEKSGMRKDRYSSAMMNYHVCQLLALELKPKQTNTINIVESLPIRKGKRFSIFN